MNQAPIVLRPAQAIFAAWIALCTLILVNGYALNLLGFPADASIIFALILIESILLTRWMLAQRVRTAERPCGIAGDPLELAGFLLVAIGTWIYFVLPSLPTLLAPSYSGDPALHVGFINSVYTTGRIIADDPGGPSLIAATLAHWLGWSPLRVLHPVAALWLALTAGGIYGIACAILPDRKEYKAIALFAVFALFVAWSYFAGIALGANYFFSQISGQLFIVAFVWFLYEYRTAYHAIWEILLIASLLSVGVLYQLWLALPGAMLVWELADGWRCGGERRERARRMAMIALAAGLVIGAAFVLNGRQFIPTLGRIKLGGTVMPPTLDALGGPGSIVLALAGLFIARRQDRFRVVVAFAFSTLLLTLALLGTRVLFGGGIYWLNKSFFLWIFPLALCSAIAIARAIEFLPRHLLASAPSLLAVFSALVAIVFLVYPPPAYAVLNESEIQVALWAKEHLNTRHIHYIGTKSLTAQWLGIAIWGEQLPGDLIADLAALGPKTFEEWRDSPGWGEYLYVSSNQHFNLDATLRVLYQQGDSMIVQKAFTNSHPPTSARPTRFGNLLALHDYELPRQTARPGQVITFTTLVETLNVPPHRVMWRLTLRDKQNNTVSEMWSDPLGNQFPLQRWPDGIVISQPFTLPLLEDVASGLYDLKLGLYYVSTGEPVGYQTNDGAADDILKLGQIKVALPPVMRDELSLITRIDQKIGDEATLLGYHLAQQSPIRPGDSFELSLYWQCSKPMSQDYTVFVHLLDQAGVLRAQRDSAPRDGTYPTSIWERDEIIVDPYIITVPRAAPPGDYRLAVGMYQWPSLQRLPVGDSDQIMLPVTITVEK